MGAQLAAGRPAPVGGRRARAWATGSRAARAGWCYGSPGVTRAIWLAGVALDRADWCELAVAAMKAVYRRPADLRQITTPSLCHGTAGLLQISLRFFHDTHDPDFADQVALLTSELLEAFDPEQPFGFVNPERDDPTTIQASLTGRPGSRRRCSPSPRGFPPLGIRRF